MPKVLVYEERTRGGKFKILIVHVLLLLLGLFLLPVCLSVS